MIMRVTQQSIYGNVISQSNASLSKLIATNLQSSTQKRINSPSDDPTGSVQVLDTRTTISQLSRYSQNSDMATGWLGQADSALTTVSTLVTTIKGLAEQATTGTISDDNRQEIAAQVRQYFEQLITLSNTEYSGNSIFAGQKTDSAAYVEGLALTTNDSTFEDGMATTPNEGWSIGGASDSTVLVQFNDTSTTPPGFEYSSDGGSTWTTGTYAASPASGTQTLQMGGVTLTVSDTALSKVTACSDHEDTNGTWLWLRPTAYYQGNNNDDVNVVAAGNTVVTASAAGTFTSNVLVRPDEDFDFTSGTTFKYSYSTDGGSTWVSGNSSAQSDGSSVAVNLPGGTMTLTANGGTLTSGEQYFVQPSTADISIDISPTDSVVVNNVGKDIFGGMYATKVLDSSTGQEKTTYTAATFDGSVSGNLFETVGKLVGYLETNNQDGIADALDDLTTSQSQVLEAASSVGARENRVSTAKTFVSMLSETANTTLSNVEDADLTSLITTLAQQELAYQAVLKSSSTVMGLSLMNYI